MSAAIWVSLPASAMLVRMCSNRPPEMLGPWSSTMLRFRASSLVSLGLASPDGEMLGPFDVEHQSQFVQVVEMAEEAAAAAAPKEETS